MKHEGYGNLQERQDSAARRAKTRLNYRLNEGIDVPSLTHARSSKMEDTLGRVTNWDDYAPNRTS